MFDYAADSSTSSSSASDYDYNKMTVDEVGDDTRAVLDDPNGKSVKNTEDQQSDDEGDEAEPTKRLAVVNMDWDNINAKDIYMIFRSFLPPEGSIEKVSIYPSNYGLKMMQNEEKFGPDQTIWQKNELNEAVKNMEDEANFIDANAENEEIQNAANQNEDDEDDEDQYEEEEEEEKEFEDPKERALHEEMLRLEKLEDTIYKIKCGRAGDVLEDEVDTVYNKQALRKYELQKLRWYYAIAEFDSIETSDRMYQELNNREYRHTCNVLSLSFVANDFVPPNEARDVCEDIPSHYIAASDKQTNALGSTYLELSWDKTDPNRMELCQRAFNEQQLHKMDLDAYLQDDDGITDAGFDTDYPVTEYDTDTPDKKVLIKRRARNRYKEILSEFKQMEKTLNDSSDEDGVSQSEGEETDRENVFRINVGGKKKKEINGSDSQSDEDIEDGIKAFRERLKAQQNKAMEKAKIAHVNVDNLSSESSENEEEMLGDREDTFNIDEEENNLNDWIETQKRLKRSFRNESDNENEGSMEDEDDDDEPLVVDGDMDREEMNDPYFKNVHDDSYMQSSAEPKKKKRRLNVDEDVDEEDELTKQQKIKERAMLEMMMADGDNVNGSYDPENAEVDHEQLSKNLNKRLKRNWRLRWLIKKAVKRKLAERDDFKFDANDSRFNSMIDDPDFAMDPNDTSFRNTKAMKGLLEQTRKRRLNKWKKKGMNKGWNKKVVRKRGENKESAKSIDHMAVIESLKIKSAKIPKLRDGQKHRIDLQKRLKQKGLSSFKT